MDKPKCRLCGERHYGHEPHVFRDVPGPVDDADSDRGAEPRTEDTGGRTGGEPPPAGPGKETGQSDNVSDYAGGRTDDPRAISPGKETGRSLSQYERNRRWREKHRERYNEYMRRYRKERKGE